MALQRESPIVELHAPAWPRWKPRLSPPAGLRLEGGRRLNPASAVAVPRTGPLISYITVVKNGAATLLRMLRSVAAQTWPHVEHIVLDGLSSDGTLDIVAGHAGQLDYFAAAADTGLYDALNKAIELATGDLICVLNADDWLTPDAAAQAAQAWLRRPAGGACLWLSAAWVMQGSPGSDTAGDSKSLWLPSPLTAAAVLRCANVCHNAVYANRAAYEASGPYRQDLRIAADFAWLVQCQRAGVACAYGDVPTIHYSLGGMSADRKRHTQECVQVLRDQVPALSADEAWGLVHCFHLYDKNLLDFAASRPAHLGRFLRDVAERHADDSYFMRALALASVTRLAHPADTRPTDKLTRGEKLRRSVQKRGLALRHLLQGRP